jgi:aryl-alcohol dehydrogenase-like predicted oxidoreductase
MKYRNNQGLRISEIGIGCYALSGVYGTKDIPIFQDMLRRAYELGVNFFDTAEAYGDAERILGDTIRPFRDKVYIATKVGIRSGSKPDLSRDYIREACLKSLAALQTSYIDLYQIHFDDLKTPVEEVIHTFEELKREGKIRYYGLGHLPVEKIRAYFELGKVFSVLHELSAVERSVMKEILPACLQYQVGLIAHGTTGRGLLTGRFKHGTVFEPGDLRRVDPLFQRERYQFGLLVADKIAGLGARYGKTPAQAAIAWVLSRPGVICALSGPSTIEHLEENLGASGLSFSSEDLAEIDLFLEKEQAVLERQQARSIRAILNEPLDQDAREAFNSLVYAIDSAIMLGFATQDQLMPVFYELFALMKKLDENGILEQLSQIQSQARDAVKLE